MIGATENAITAALKAAADDGRLGYAWHTLDSYPEDFDAYLKEKGQLRTPGAWAVFLGLADGVWQSGATGWTAEARFAVVVAAQNLRNETASRQGGPDSASEPGSYQLSEDAIRVLANQDFDFLAEPVAITGARLVARTPEMRRQGLSLMALELRCRIVVSAFADAAAGDDFTLFHADWDVPPLGNVTQPLPAAAPDAADMIAVPQ